MKKIALALSISLLLLTLCACTEKKDETPPLTDITESENTSSVTANESAMDFFFKAREKDASFSGGLALDLSKKTSVDGANWEDGHLKITAAGTYILCGKSDSYIEVAAGENDKIQLVLNGAEIKNSGGPALYISSADKVYLTLADGTKNILSDGNEYTFSQDDGLDATLFSRADLCINGNGTLDIEGNQKHAVVSKDDLVITGGKLNITAQAVALDGKDCLKIGGGTLNLSAGTDGMRSSNTEEGERGYIYIADGKINIKSQNDAVQAETVLRIDGGEITAQSGGGSENASYKDGGWNDRWMMPPEQNGSNTETTESAKGLKAAAKVNILGGTITLDTADDTVHSNGDIEITGGRFSLFSGDDGMHADGSLKISGGEITLQKSYEGLEGSEIVISDGKIDLTSSDDGINAAGGNDGSALGGRPGMGHFESTNGSIEISGGYLFIKAAGDGVDSNGSLTVSGGVTLVSGPETQGNGALDYAADAKITGGTFIATGSSGMASGFTSAENQGAIIVNVAAQSSGTSVALCDGEKIIAAFTPSKAYSSVVVSAPKIEKGKTYSLILGGNIENADENGYTESGNITGGQTAAEITMEELLYGSSGGMGGMHGGGMGPGMHGGMGGGRPGGKGF